MRLSLRCHPDTPCASLKGIDVEIIRGTGGEIELHYFVSGKIRDVLWPEGAAPERTDRLWEHSCFELFVGAAGRPGYHEFNLAPSSAWAAYRFSDYRAGMQIASAATAPEIASRVTAKTYVLRAIIPLAGLPALPEGVDWRIGLSAVIEEKHGGKHYWALAHPAGKPDFHHPDCFALTLAAPGTP
jgi:hypothetical protein